MFWRLHARSGETTGAATSPTWQFTVGAHSTPVDTSWGTTLDVNGDGYADVVVGEDSLSSRLAALHLYLGGAAGLATTASWTQAGAAVGDVFGGTVTSAGDVNGDGYADLVVGAPGTASGAGAVYLYLGGARGLGATAAWMQTGAVSPDELGAAVTGAGDVNGDGYADVLVTAGNAGAGYAGTAYVYLGSARGLGATPAWTQTGAEGLIAFAGGIASAGDVDGDGYADVAMFSGLPMGGLQGAVNVYRGGPTGLETTPAWTEPAAVFASAGDVNADGYADLIVGLSQVGTSIDGAASVYLGSATGLATTPAWTQPGPARSFFGTAVTCAGDVNADGYADVIVGAPGEGDSLLGAVYLYLGGPMGLSTTAAWTQTGQRWGIPVVGAGDVDRDGYADLLLGAYWTSSLTGSAFVYLGGATGLGSTPAWTQTGTANSQFGSSVARAATCDRAAVCVGA